MKQERKSLQERNVARKRRKEEEHKAHCLAGMGGAGGGASQEEEIDDAGWYRKEVGEEPDPGRGVVQIP